MTLARDSTVSRADLRFGCRVAELVDRHRRRWASAAAETPRIERDVGFWRRFRNARATRRLIRELAERIEDHPDGRREVEAWRREIRERVQRFGERRFGWPAGYRDLAFGDDFYRVTAAFVGQARRFDPGARMEDVGQAMRNVWIVNSLQMLFGAPVELTPAIFAYSMLYPYTDNLLDDPALPATVKTGMNERLGRWLSGEPALPRGARELRIRRLLAMIESHYPRHRYDSVYQSLLAIHRGQVRSLRLQSGRPRPDRGSILATQIEKGGASVLADGYLIGGWLGAAEEDFCFGYGVFLQLLDDLQDAAADREAGHATLFSVDAGRRPLDRLVGRLWSYMRGVIDGAECLGGPGFADRKDLILRNCTVLMVSAIAERPDFFTRSFRRSIERGWPLGLRAMRALRRYGQKRLGRARRELERRKNVRSLWDLVVEG